MIHTIQDLEAPVTPQTYLDEQLQAVSRSFALVIPSVEEPLRQYLATAYLLCRVVDNIEDSGRSATWQAERFAECALLLRDPDQATEVLARWEREAWPALTEHERAMMGVAKGHPVWRLYADMPAAAQATVRHWVTVMADGMQALANPDLTPAAPARPDLSVLATVADYNRYCYFVAGTVGHMATELVLPHYQLTGTTAQALRAHAEACGRALQKTNIVKDFAKDLQRGLCYVPAEWLRQAGWTPLDLRGAPSEWSAQVLLDVAAELRQATDYILALPTFAAGYRRAALLCLLPAYQTILCAAERHRELFTPAHDVKISRATMMQCLVDAQAMLLDNDAILRYSRRLQANIGRPFGFHGPDPEP